MTDYSLLSSPFSSPNVASLLNIKILSWSQETGFPVCIRVRIADTTFNLHKHPLVRKSGYFREKLKGSNEVDLPPDFPGGPKTFEMIALFIYGSSTLVDPSNVASLRCAAEFLIMTEEHAPGNLCERFDIYLNQVVLQSWDDTLVVLHNCLALLPWAEDLLIVSRCIETLAFMACMEILDPERRRDRPVVTLETWTDISEDLWINDLVDLPFEFFERVVGSLRRQGMEEKYVGPIVLFYADKWVRKNKGGVSVVMMRGVIDLLPSSDGMRAIPVGFYFSLLSTAVEILGSGSDGVAKLRNRIASVLHLGRAQDFLSPKDDGLSVMEAIFSTYYLDFSTSTSTNTTIRNNYVVVAELWDLYLNRIAAEKNNSELISCKRFMNLIETVPISSRQMHDHLYRAINTFFQSHPNLLQEEKGLICKYLNCQKLSQEACIEAVQNEMMPLRLIVQALFVQQLNTQQAFKECSDSFRYTGGGGEYSGSLSSSRYTNGSDQGGMSRPLNVLLQKDSSVRRHNNGNGDEYDDMESTSFRMENLEKELVSLKKRLQLQQQKNSKKNINDKDSRKIKPVASKNMGTYYGSVDRRISEKKDRSCIGNVSFASQRKYANRILKLLQRISLFGRGRSKRRPTM
ncbi:BTB/POZ domain-containing protein at5g48130 [Phtheirospermum japonicum]|uniref:BTB/POZ domain-containing protein at5g48130 n=1 Tax=Phtheirospermum japonicum TaxID=374723 RepID=A0A830BFD5_9LAMI|nr:BTB/POZ domain-containing protein at5g48130 [Phtheirospermum japonicum]